MPVGQLRIVLEKELYSDTVENGVSGGSERGADDSGKSGVDIVALSDIVICMRNYGAKLLYLQ